MYYLNLLLFTKPSAEHVTAAICVDPWARLQFRFFLNLVSLGTQCSLLEGGNKVNLRCAELQTSFIT